MVDRIFRTLAEAGVTVLRFDFRDTGQDERYDVIAAVEEVARHLEPGRPLWLVGYSFGADIALGVGHERPGGWRWLLHCRSVRRPAPRGETAGRS